MLLLLLLRQTLLIADCTECQKLTQLPILQSLHCVKQTIHQMHSIQNNYYPDRAALKNLNL